MAAVVVPGLTRQTPYAGPHGTVCVARKKYTVDLAQNDTLDIVLIPKGAVVLDTAVQVTALGASVTMSVGLVAAGAGAKGGAALFNSAADVSAAAYVKKNVTGKFADSDFYLDDDDYYLRLTLAAANPASGTYEAIVWYAFPGLM